MFQMYDSRTFVVLCRQNGLFDSSVGRFEYSLDFGLVFGGCPPCISGSRYFLVILKS